MAMTGEAVFFHKLIGSVKKKKSNYIFSLLLLKGQKCKGALRQDDRIASGCGLLPFPQGLADLPIRHKITSRHKIWIEKGLCPGDGMLPQEGQDMHAAHRWEDQLPISHLSSKHFSCIVSARCPTVATAVV